MGLRTIRTKVPIVNVNCELWFEKMLIQVQHLDVGPHRPFRVCRHGAQGQHVPQKLTGMGHALLATRDARGTRYEVIRKSPPGREECLVCVDIAVFQDLSGLSDLELIAQKVQSLFCPGQWIFGSEGPELKN